MNIQIPIFYKLAIGTLKQIQQIFPNAIFAGGCVRDLYLDQPIKDFDIFIHIPTHSSADLTLTEWANLVNVSSSRDISMKPNSPFGHNNPHIRGVFSFTKQEIKYDVIYVDTPPIEHVNRFFDIGLCKAYFDGKKFTFTPDFLKDKENKTLTILGEDMTPADIEHCRVAHLPRIQLKYPSFKETVASHLIGVTKC